MRRKRWTHMRPAQEAARQSEKRNSEGKIYRRKKGKKS